MAGVHAKKKPWIEETCTALQNVSASPIRRAWLRRAVAETLAFAETASREELLEALAKPSHRS